MLVLGEEEIGDRKQYAPGQRGQVRALKRVIYAPPD